MHHNIHLLLLILLSFADILPPSMTCNIGMLSDFFGGNKNDTSDWFLEDYNKIMINKIKNQFDHFGNNYQFYIYFKLLY